MESTKPENGTEDNTGASITQAEFTADREDGQPKGQGSGNGSGEKKVEAKNLNYAERVENQHIHYREEMLELTDILMPFDRKADRARWENVQTDGEGYDTNLNQLLEKQIVFIVSDDHRHRRSLACHLSYAAALAVKDTKEIFFNLSGKRQGFGLLELVNKLDEDSGLFIVGDLGKYNLVPFQKKFLDSFTHQLHTGIPLNLRKKKSFIVILITSYAARNIISNIENYKHYFSIWTIDDLQADKVKTPDPETFFPEMNYIQKVLLYAATFFNGVTFRVFDSIVDMLLAGSLSQEPIAMKQYKDLEAGADKVMQVINQDKEKIWEMYKDQFFRDCHLTGKEEGGVYIVDFKFPDLAEKCRKYFKEQEHFFWQHQFSILEQNGMVFHRNDQVGLKVMEIIMDAMQDDPYYYDNSWLWNLARSVKDFEHAEIVPGGDSQESLLTGFLDWIKRSSNAYFFYNRLGQILTQMLGRGLDERVKYFLNSLVEYNDPDVLLKLVQRLVNAIGFDKFYWIKQLIDSDNREVMNDTYLWLLKYVSYYERDKTWEAIKTWMPADKKLGQFSPSNHYACFFVIHYHVYEVAFVPVTNYGVWPGEYPLFAGYDEDAERCKEHIRFVINTSFLESTEFQFGGKNQEHLAGMMLELFYLGYYRKEVIKALVAIEGTEGNGHPVAGSAPSYYSLLADLMETWYFMLGGYGEQASSQALELSHFILSTLVQSTQEKPAALNAITRQWEKKVGVYRRELDRIRTAYNEQKEEWDEDEHEVIQAFLGSIQKRRESLEYMFEAFNTHL